MRVLSHTDSPILAAVQCQARSGIADHRRWGFASCFHSHGTRPSALRIHTLLWLRNAASFADAFSEQRFLDAMTVVLAHALYLPAAQCFALVPGLHGDLHSWYSLLSVTFPNRLHPQAEMLRDGGVMQACSVLASPAPQLWTTTQTAAMWC